MSDVPQTELDNVAKLKEASRGSRKRGDRLAERSKFTRSAAAFLEGITALESAIDILAGLSVNEPSVIKEQSDCLGMLGGLYRRLSTLCGESAVHHYEAGREFEKRLPERQPNSYNLVNAIVVRLLNTPTHLQATKPQLEGALTEVRRQLESHRRGDTWALADQVTLTALLDKDWDDATKAFLAANPEQSAIESCAQVLDALAAGLPDRQETLKAAAALLRVRLKSS